MAEEHADRERPSRLRTAAQLALYDAHDADQIVRLRAEQYPSVAFQLRLSNGSKLRGWRRR
jgi:hypothetical protein